MLISLACGVGGISLLPATETPTSTPTPMPTPFGGGNGLFAFVSMRYEEDPTYCWLSDTCNDEVFIARLDGKGEVNISNSTADDWWPKWSPDGTRLAFVSNRNGNNDIFIVNADGGGLFQLTTSDQDDHTPSWSPDGRQIVYTSYQEGNADIFIINADGSGEPIQITDHPSDDFYPAWSPAGDLIAFVTERNEPFPDSCWSSGCNKDIFVVNPDGTNLRNLTESNSDDWWFEWSPDGTRIVYEGKRDGMTDLYVVNIQTRETLQLTDMPEDEWAGPWSPDSSRLLFSYEDDVYMINADGSGMVQLTTSYGNDYGAAWSPDGMMILFVSMREEPNPDNCWNVSAGCNTEIFIMTADGREAHNLSNSIGEDFNPVWQP
jgi:Tol biopolymer transport system component